MTCLDHLKRLMTDGSWTPVVATDIGNVVGSRGQSGSYP